MKPFQPVTTLQTGHGNYFKSALKKTQCQVKIILYESSTFIYGQYGYKKVLYIGNYMTKLGSKENFWLSETSAF